MKWTWDLNRNPWHLYLGAPLGAVAIALTVGACSSDSPPPVSNGGDTSIGLRNAGAHFMQDLGDGTKLECWFISTGAGHNGGMGGPTCDWISYHKRYDKTTGGK